MALSLQSVYDQYLSNYSHSLPGRGKGKINSERKNETMDVYRSILKLNRNSPVFVQNFTDTAKADALHLKQSALLLKETISPFISAEQSSGDQFQSAYSTDSFMADIRYSPGFDSSAPKEFTLQIHETATQQINTGHFLSDAMKRLPEGDYHFDISMDRASYAFQLSIGYGESYTNIQKRIANMINRSHIGMTASILTNSKNHSALQFAFDTEGLPNEKNLQFDVTDMHYGNPVSIVSALGMDQISQYPHNASLTIDGKTYCNPTNQVALTNGFQLYLKQASDHPAHISLQTDTDAISSQIEKMLQDYNATLNEIRNFKPPSPTVNILAKDISAIPKHLEDELKDIGISIHEENEFLSFSKETFLQAYEKEHDVTTLLKPMTQFSQNLTKRLDQVVINPLKYICQSMVAYKNITKDNFASPYETSMFSGAYFNACI